MTREKTVMPETTNPNCLSFGDALFLYLERAGAPLHVASLCVFEGKIERGDCLQHFAAKLPLIPRYRQHVVSPPLNIGLPSWQFDPHFDLANHVREVTLKHGTEAELKKAAGRMLSVPMDRSRPLWDVTLMQGFKGGRTGLLIRVHHSLADGLSGVGLMNTILDADGTRSHPPSPPAQESPVSETPPPSLLQSLVDSCFNAVQRVLAAESELLALGQHLLAGAGENDPSAEAVPHNGFHANGRMPSIDELNRLIPELLEPAERLPFNVVCRGPQKFECAEVPLPELKAIKHDCGVSVNDVVLALVGSAIRRYAQARRIPLRGRKLRVVVPVSVRSKAEKNELGNRITFVPVNIPLHIAGMRKLVAAVHENVTLIKNARVAELVGFAGTLLGSIPAPVQAALGPIASQLPLSVANLICTNVPGPMGPLYLLGHKMLSCHPYVPIGGEMGMNIAVLSYNGVAYFGFTGDVNAAPDLALIPRFLNESFAELQKALGRAPKRKRQAAAKPRRAVTPAAPEHELEKGPSPVLDFPVKEPPAIPQQSPLAAAGD